VPDELWNEVCDTVQETGIKTITMGKKCKKAKWLSREALQIAVKRREAKSKGEKQKTERPWYLEILKPSIKQLLGKRGNISSNYTIFKK